MSRDSRRHGHQAFMAWSQSSLSINMATVSDSSWEEFFSGLVNLLDICENYSLNIKTWIFPQQQFCLTSWTSRYQFSEVFLTVSLNSKLTLH